MPFITLRGGDYRILVSRKLVNHIRLENVYQHNNKYAARVGGGTNLRIWVGIFKVMETTMKYHTSELAN